jgi:hypothetical protein
MHVTVVKDINMTPNSFSTFPIVVFVHHHFQCLTETSLSSFVLLCFLTWQSPRHQFDAGFYYHSHWRRGTCRRIYAWKEIECRLGHAGEAFLNTMFYDDAILVMTGTFLSTSPFQRAFLQFNLYLIVVRPVSVVG